MNIRRYKAELISLKSRPLRVLIIADSFLPFIDGVARVIENYAEQFEQKNVDFRILAPRYKSADLSSDEKYKGKIIRLKTSRLKWGSYEVFKFPIISEEQQLIDDFNPDIIHVHSPFIAGKIAVSLKNRYNIPIVFTMHKNFKQSVILATNNDLFGTFSGFLMNQFTRQIDHIFYVSNSSMKINNFSASIMQSVVGDGTKFKYTENSSDLAKKAITKFNIDTTKHNLLFISKFIWEKNIKLLLDAFKTLLTVDKNYSLTMVGGDWNFDEIIEYAKELEIYNQINFTGWVNDEDLLKGLYLSHDLLISPSILDTFGLVVHEAASQGLASLVIKNSPSSEGIVDGENGYVTTQHEQQMADKIREIFENKHRLKVVGKNAMDLTKEWSDVVDISIEKYIDTIKSFYEKDRIRRLKKVTEQVRAKFKK